MKGSNGFVYVLISDITDDSPWQANKFMLDLNESLIQAFKSAGTGSTSLIVEWVLGCMFDQTPQSSWDKLDDMEHELQEITTTMNDNLSRVLDRGESMEMLSRKSEALRNQTSTFFKRTKELQWTNYAEYL